MKLCKSVLASCLAACLCFGCRKPAAPPFACSDCSYLLVSVDTLRADHLGCYGYQRPTSPNIDNLARRSLVFENAYTPRPQTLVAHVSLMSGLYPQVHGTYPGLCINPSLQTLPQHMQAAGFETADFTTHSIWLGPKTGFDRGFGSFFTKDFSGEELNEKIFGWLDQHHKKKFFLFVHYYDVHSDFKRFPYETGTELDLKFAPAPADYQPCDAKNRCGSQYLTSSYEEGFVPPPSAHVAHIVGRYDGGIAYTDRLLASLFEKLAALGLNEKLVIVLTSDHGEEFLEHSRFLHTQATARPRTSP